MDADAQALPETKANEGGDSEVSQPLVSPSTPQQPTLTAQPSTPFSSKETFRQTLNAGMGGLMDVLVERICTLEALMLEREEQDKVSEEDREDKGPQTMDDMRIIVKELKERITRMEAHEKEQDKTIKTLTFNVSGAGEDDKGGGSSTPPSPNTSKRASTPTLHQGSITDMLKVEVTDDMHKLNAKKAKNALKAAETMARLKDSALLSAKIRKDEETKRKEQEEDQRRIRELQEKHAKEARDLINEKTEAAAQKHREMEEKILKMQEDFAEREKKDREEKDKREKEATERLKHAEEEAAEARKQTDVLEKELRQKHEEAMVVALKKKANEDEIAGSTNNLALRALKAAEVRQMMDPEKRARAKMRWKKAMRSVMSPANIIKRAMGNFGKQKVDKTQTVVSRVVKVEEETGKMDCRLRQVEKLMKKHKQRLLKEAAAEHLRKKEMKLMKTKNERMSNLWDELSDAVLGTSAQIATASLNVIEGTNTHAPVKSGEASHRDTVISSLKTASQDENITDAKLKQKFSSLADKISRPLADDFGPLEVAKMIIELLQNYDEELSFLRHTKGRAKTMGPRRMGSIVMHQSLTMNNLRRDSEDGDSDEDGDKGEDAKLLDKEILKSEEEEQPDHITLKEMLRLELHRLVSINIAQNSGGGDAKKFSNLMKFMEDEIARLEGANRALSRTMEKQIGALTKQCEFLAKEQGRLGDGLGVGMNGLEDKVADFKSLLELKAEKERVIEINGAIGNVRDDLSTLKNKLPDKELTDSLKAVKRKVEGKMDKKDMKKLMNSMKKDTLDPALGKRCLSCDRPLETSMDFFGGTGGGQERPMSASGLPHTMQANYATYQIGNWSPQTKGRVGGEGEMYKDYAKPKSPYKRMSGIRPKSAHAKNSSSGTSSGNPYKYNKPRSEASDARRYGREKPLHVTLFSNDKVRKVRSSKGKDKMGSGGSVVKKKQGKSLANEEISQWEAMQQPETYRLEAEDDLM